MAATTAVPFRWKNTVSPLTACSAPVASNALSVTVFLAEITQTLNEMLRFIRATQKKQEEQERRIFDLEAEIRQLKEGTEKKA